MSTKSSKTYSQTLLSVSAIAIAAFAQPASAQEANLEIAESELPPIVVQGATLDKPKVRVKKKVSQQSETIPGPPESNNNAEVIEPGPAEPSSASSSADTQEVSGTPAKEISSAVTIVTGQQLKAQQVRHAADALRSLPGVAVSQGGSAGGKTQIRIRGAEGNHTLVMIDGIDASSPNDNEFDFSDLLADDIERIEVIRGGQSGIYGSKAIGGVINIITRGGKGPITLQARSEIGSYGTKDVSVRASGGTDKAWIAITGSYREQDDFNWDRFGTEDDPWRNRTVNVRAGFSPVEGVNVDFVVRNSQKFANTDGDAFFPIPQTGRGGAVDTPDTSDVDLFLGGVTVRWDMPGGAWTHIVKANKSRTDADAFSFGSASNNLGEAETYSYLLTHRFSAPELLDSKHSISGFIEKKDEEFTPTSLFTDGLTRERGHTAVVGEYRVGFYDRLFVTGTVRHDDNEKFRDFTTWHAGASLALSEYGLRPHVGIGTSVALPGMFEQFGSILGVFVGNPNLKPEESYSWDAGVEFTTLQGRAVLDVTYFDADLTNKIQGFGNTMINLLGESQRRGVEISGRMLVAPGLTVGASYTYLDAQDPTGLEEVRRPPHTGRFDVNYAFDNGRGNVNLAAIYNGDQIDNDFSFFPSVRQKLDAYWLVNAAASYEVQPGLELYGRVENLLDEDYEEILGYNTLGAAVYGGVRIKLEDPSTAAWAKYK